jgi:hemerythrin-like domain-containing protein
MKRHPFVNTNLIQTIEEEIKLLEEGKSNVEQAKSVIKVAQRLISLKMFEIQEEEKVLLELIKKISSYKG